MYFFRMGIIANLALGILWELLFYCGENVFSNCRDYYGFFCFWFRRQNSASINLKLILHFLSMSESFMINPQILDKVLRISIIGDNPT